MFLHTKGKDMWISAIMDTLIIYVKVLGSITSGNPVLEWVGAKGVPERPRVKTMRVTYIKQTNTSLTRG